MIYQLPFVANDGDYDFSTTIEGTSYLFQVRWNSGRDGSPGCWYFDVLDAQLVPIVSGIKIVLGVYLGRRSPAPLFTDGVFIAQDLSGAQADATYVDLGTRVVVFYIPNLDLAQILSGG